MPPKRNRGNLALLKGIAGAIDAVEPGSMTMLDLSLDLIEINPDQPRKVFDKEALDALKDSIALHGLQQPVGVQQQPGGRYRIVFGERRLRAFQMLDRPTIPAVVIDPSVAADEAALVENLVRADLNPFEEADAVGALYDRLDGKSSYDEIGRMIGRSKSEVGRLMAIRRIGEAVRAEYLAHKPPMSVLAEIARLDDPDEQIGAWENYKASKRPERLPVPGVDGGPDEAAADAPPPAPERKTRPALEYNSALPPAVARRIYGSAKHLADLRQNARTIHSLKAEDLKTLEMMHAEISAILEAARQRTHADVPASK